MTDKQIIDLYWQREEAAIRESNIKYGSYCHTVARNILSSPEDASECVNDTWLRAWNTIPPTRPGRLDLFLAKITRNLAFDRFKTRSAVKRGGGEMPLILSELQECIADRADVESTVLAEELKQCICQFVRTLPARDGNVFVRRYFFADSIAEIAGRYGLTAGNVTVILSRTRGKLKIQLEQEGFFV